MSRETFILSHTEKYLKHETTAKQTIARKEKLALCLSRLRQGDYYYTIAEMTEHGLSTIQNTNNGFFRVILSNLWHKL